MSRNLKLLIALIVIATIAAYVVLVFIPTQMAKRSYEAAKEVGEEIRKVFQFTPEIRVNNTIVLNQQTSLFELAVLEQSFEHRYVWESSWLGSTKKIFISGTFQAKAGFDLHKKFSIVLRDEKAYVTLPAPQALSVESRGDIVYRDEQGIWNWVDLDDRTRATNAFIRDARRYAGQAKFVGDARQEIERRLKTLLAPYVEEVVIEYTVPVEPR
jgi:hypothetical protein